MYIKRPSSRIKNEPQFANSITCAGVAVRRDIHLNNEDHNKHVAISVITATLNAAEHLPGLIASLRAQTDKDFEWVVADGASDDGTLELLRAVTDINIRISSQKDLGIYDALNRAIEISSGEYYIVSGADDHFFDDAIEKYRAAIMRSKADIIAANYRYAFRVIKIKKGPSWLFGQASYIAGHTLATAFKKDLHRLFGAYSGKYQIGSDQFFVLTACKGGASVYRADFVAGEMGAAGVSSVDRIGVAFEFFKIQMAVGGSLFIQSILLVLRLLGIVISGRRR
jgi:glycosyltransferase involved in cell wall biosynthesis